jgi:hypothetical protein
MDHPPLTSRHLTLDNCTNLRHKGMYVYASGTVEPDYDDFLSTTSFWCACTQKAFGPDGHPVNARDCVHGRNCCDH